MSAVVVAVLIVLLLLLWFVWVMPQRRRQRRHAEELAELIEMLEPGDEIITAGGIHATVRTVIGEELMVEIASGVVVRMDRRAVVAVTTIADADEPAPETEPAAHPAGSDSAAHR
jgi:preprotein translocase subunit YajC